MEAVGAKGSVEIVEPTRPEQLLARRAAESRATVPHFELRDEVDAGACLALADGAVTPVIVRAAALALREHPRANGAYRDGRFELYSRVNVGVSLTADERPVTATVFDADRKRLAALAAEIRSLQERAAELTPPERSGATFTVWLAAGVSGASPVIPIGHSAALSAGEPRAAAVVRDGALAPGHVISLTLACDHRILHGTHATRFLARIRRLLEHPESL